MKHLKTIFIILILFTGVHAKGQDLSDIQVWNDLTVTHPVTNKHNFSADMGIRGIITQKDWNLIYVRPRVRYYPSALWNLGGSIATFHTINSDIGNSTELRFAQEANLHWPQLVVIDFNQRVRFEERLFFYEKPEYVEGDLREGWYTRGRYQLSFETQDFIISSNPFYFLGAVEFFMPVNSSAVEVFVNQNRWTVGLGHRIKEKFKYELEYTLQHSNNYSDTGLRTTQHLLRLRFYLLTKPFGTEKTADIQDP